MKKLNKYVIASVFLSFPHMLFAGVASGYKNIERLDVGGNGLNGTFIKLAGYSFTGCASTVAFVDAVQNPNYKEIFSTVLAAKMAGTMVQVQTQGCGGSTNAYPLVTEINLQ